MINQIERAANSSAVTLVSALNQIALVIATVVKSRDLPKGDIAPGIFVINIRVVAPKGDPQTTDVRPTKTARRARVLLQNGHRQ
ncbi:hypothetical protein [Bradyrhizobium archetypum]|uniref:Uncharacterized protein n=1 Tax=Bradyrhizobium archetypum TaxID=2721160 RepID=A0A7Y4H068_9BRAD|nr:hypothetical protein [Bradyrhizobium archetypum]NOJ44914.1 hypothetical protein [Bradyrhizobium archetypum]